jgi:hypothetical protein
MGYFLDVRGKGASMMLYGAILMTISHLIFALVPSDVFNVPIAIITIVIIRYCVSHWYLLLCGHHCLKLLKTGI